MSQFGYGTPEQRILDAVEAITISTAHQAHILATVLAYVAESAYQDAKHPE